VCTNEPCDLLATLGPESTVFQSHELVRVALNLICYSFTGLNDGDGYGAIRSWDVASFSVNNASEGQEGG